MKKNKYQSINQSSSIFSVDYKIPYESSSQIAQHLEESQQQIHFIKVKLTQAYEKLEIEIKLNSQLQQEIENLNQTLKQIEQKYLFEKKENTKLKETLQIILKNRKLMTEQNEEYKESMKKNIAEKQKINQQLKIQLNTKNLNLTELSRLLQEKQRQFKNLKDEIKSNKSTVQKYNDREQQLINRINLLEQQMNKITDEKFIQVNRLRHELSLYQKSAINNSDIQYRERDFSRQRQIKKYGKKYDTYASEEDDLILINKIGDFNKQNINSLQLPQQNSTSIDEVIPINKWKKSESIKNRLIKDQVVEPISTAVGLFDATDDQKLTQCQISKKKIEQQLCSMEKIKRPTPEERQKMDRLQKQIYHLDSDIAGLKRKIRRKY